MQIRLAQREQAAQLAELNRQFNGVVQMSGVPVEGPERVLVADLAGEIVGFACVQVIRSMCYAAPWAELTELFVASASRRCGVGAALVAEAERCAWQEGCSELVLRANVNNGEARALFAKRGFAEAKDMVLRKPRPESKATERSNTSENGGLK